MKKILLVSKEVYAPQEDSFLLEEVLLRENVLDKECIDVGCGSGIQTLVLLKGGAKKVIAVDINPLAVKATKSKIKCLKSKTQKLGHCVSVFQSNLFESIPPRIKFDLIVFNPPYVPSDEIKWIDLDGGKDGRVIIDRFIKAAPKYLRSKGLLFLLVSSLNKPKYVIAQLRKKGFEVSIAQKKKLFFEELMVLKCVKN